MKRLTAVFVMLVLFGMCVPSYGTILVYDVFATVKAVDAMTSDIDRSTVNGVLVVDYDATEKVIYGSSLVLYGRDTGGNRVYRTYDDMVSWTVYGNVAAVIADLGQGGKIILTGRIRRSYINFRERLVAANNLDGILSLESGVLLDVNQSLTGSGTVNVMLDVWRTRNAISGGGDVSDVIDGFIERLETRGFVAVGSEEEPPPLPG